MVICFWDFLTFKKINSNFWFFFQIPLGFEEQVRLSKTSLDTGRGRSGGQEIDPGSAIGQKFDPALVKGQYVDHEPNLASDPDR